MNQTEGDLFLNLCRCGFLHIGGCKMSVIYTV